MVDNQDADNTPQTETTITKSSPNIGRLIVRIFLLVVIPVIAVVFGAQWYEKTGRFIETENAYVKTNVIAISDDIDGIKVNDTIGFIPYSEYEFVLNGKRLYRVLTKFITIKYEYKGNQKEYNPRWAQSS